MFFFILLKEQLLKQSPPILDLGLLFETGIDVSSVRELSSFVCFHHKLLQEYSGSYFLERYLRNVNNIKVLFLLSTLNFSRWLEIIKSISNYKSSTIFKDLCVHTIAYICASSLPKCGYLTQSYCFRRHYWTFSRQWNTSESTEKW